MRPALALVRLQALAFLTISLFVAPAEAYTFGPYGCNLRWDQCYGDGGAINRNFACDTNTGSETLVGSFVPAWDIANVAGLEVVMNLASASAVLPAWWNLRNAGTCRATSLGFFSTPAAPSANCPDWSAGQSSGGSSPYSIGLRGPNTARIVLVTAVPAGSLANLTGRSEYFAFRLTINHQKTVGTGSCAGCTTPVCILLQSVNQVTPSQSTSRWLTGPANLVDSDYVTWQGGGVPVVLGTSGCPAATPTRASTWGAVKSLYR